MKEKRRDLWVVGSGRMGGALARALKKAHLPVYGVARNETSARRWRRLGISLASLAKAPRVELVFLAVPDDRVQDTGARLARALPPGTPMAHCAGALELGSLAASFHPLVAVSNARDSLAGAAVSIAARTPTLDRRLVRLARDLELTPLRVPEEARSLYHAGAVLAAGGVVATLSAAVEAWRALGVSERDALRALLPLTQSALRAVEERGLLRGLTGPVVRRDTERIRAHWDALPSHLRSLYAVLSQEALRRVATEPE